MKMKEFLTKKAITKMQAIIIAIVVIIAAVSAGVYLSLRPSTPEAILVGVPAPLTGAGAQMGEPIPWIVSYIENAINKEGGIYIKEYGKKIPIKFLVKDTQADFDLTAAVTEELITKDQVSLILVPIGALTMPAAGMKAEKYNVPCILHFCPSTTVELMGPSKWVYYTTFSAAEETVLMIEAYKLIQTNRIIAGLWVNNANGQTDRNITISIAEKEGFKVVDLGLYSPGLTDFSSYIEQMKAAKAEICHAYCWFEEASIFWRQCHEMGYIPKLAFIGMGAVEPSNLVALGGDLGLGLLAWTMFSPALPFKESITGKTVKELYDMYAKETGKTAGVNMASYVGFEIAIDVLRRAQSIDREKIRSALAETNLDTAWGNINFKKPYSQLQRDLYAQWEPALLSQEDHICVLPNVVGQWVKENGTWVCKVVYNWVYTEIPVQKEITPIPGSK
jgi:branched-chain amino acid transport system substrate-binding protein